MKISTTLRNAITSLLLAAPFTACSSFNTAESTNQSQHQGDQCTFTQGFWKNHAEDWPVLSLDLGGRTYNQAELLAILDTEVSGNGLIALAHQLIAAKLNVAYGAPDADIADEIAAADALIGSLVVPPIGDGYLETSVTSDLNDALDIFNNSELEGAECVDDEPEPYCGDDTVDAGEECDDGNTTDGDGCSANCTIEPPPPPPPYCGDDSVDAGEECDDGNTTDGDGCSANCTIEPPPPPPPCCGDNTVDAGEECDDGNTIDGDGCSATCTIEPPPPASCCGDGTVDADEQCDDGNTADGDGCSATCTVEEVCPVVY